MAKYLSNSRRRHPAAFAAQRSQVYAGCVNLAACGHPYRFAGRDDSAYPGMKRSRVGKFAKVLSQGILAPARIPAVRGGLSDRAG
jgi:hypothetical protein